MKAMFLALASEVNAEDGNVFILSFPQQQQSAYVRRLPNHADTQAHQP